jgi:hypothetical protein
MKTTKRMIALCLILVLAFSLAACGSKPAPAEPAEPEPTPSMALDNMLKAIGDLDFEEAQKYYAGDMGSVEALNEGADSPTADVVTRMLREAFSFEYTLSNEVISQDGQTATVDVNFVTYNMGEILEQVLEALIARASVLQQGGMTADEFQTQMNDIVVGIYEDIIKKAEKTLKISVPVKLTKVDGEWKVDDLKDSLDFMDGITGGLISYSESGVPGM